MYNLIFRSMRIGTRLTVAFSSLLLLLLIVSIVLLNGMQHMRTITQDIVKVQVSRLSLAQEADTHAQSAANYLLQLLQVEQREQRIPLYALMDAELTSLDHAVVKISESMLSNEAREQVNRLTKVRTLYNDLFHETVETIELDGVESAREHFKSKTRAALTGLLQATASLSEQQKIDMNLNLYQSEQTEEKNRYFIATFIVSMLVLGVMLSWVITRSILTPIDESVSVAENIAQGNLEQAIPFGGKDEMGQLLTSLAVMRDSIVQREELLLSNIELKKINFAISSDLQVAEDVMSHIMRSDGLRDPVIRYFQRPTQQFGGDFISVARDNKGDLRVLLADVTGHGLQAALFLLPTFRVFHTMAKKGLQISEIATELNRTMHEISTTGHFIAAALAHVSNNGSLIEVWNGGIPSVFYIQQDGGLHQFHSLHPPLGILKAGTFETATECYYAQPGTLLLSSDGLTEAENTSGEPFGDERFEALLRTSPQDKIFDSIFSAIEAHLGGNAAHDDLSLLLAKCGV